MKKVNSIFEVLGPVMIGPSSSHTAGAARLGKLARDICNGKIKKVRFYLHGSFAKTYKGHGTDRALIAGILGYEPDDERLRDAINIASEQGLKYEFILTDLGLVHPNTVKFMIEDINGKITEVTGSSIGGGSVMITDINGFEVKFTGEYSTIITNHLDKRGIISEVSGILAHNRINIANMNVLRNSGAKDASMIIEVDSIPNNSVIDMIKELDPMKSVIVINKERSGEDDV
ncbi:L-serine ammonia-lyase, iron-sulfur-dependent subunit beta [Sedimentibacter sp. zth1]|uniref:L-serine ammonia-lyase, iron-sulfur-dependent subunit beta n=1 Tax=Sedimentibacter sp. zth1 TaxID=2816908 RepID=UPI001A917FD8|nr:L-serine ammonia-lyase, iron-sulfur-dependent subunit beta [Sedimentibacter sp. zth1]QSX05146.1 L-serine ammonia-lyase, iron-sulfur-dependent subunit beta [Sedimentibacter sp. zth1]